MNKLPFELRTRLDDAQGSEGSRERLYRMGRIFLLGGAGTIGLEMVINAIYGGGEPLTLRSIFDLAPQSVLAQILAPIEPILDKPLWLVLVVAGAVPYVVAAVDQWLKDRTRP